MGVLTIRAPLLGVYITVPKSLETPMCRLLERAAIFVLQKRDEALLTSGREFFFSNTDSGALLGLLEDFLLT